MNYEKQVQYTIYTVIYIMDLPVTVRVYGNMNMVPHIHQYCTVQVRTEKSQLTVKVDS